MLTCTGSTVADMKRNVELITTLPSLSRAISEARTEVFNGCGKKDTCAGSKEYLERAAALGAGQAGRLRSKSFFLLKRNRKYESESDHP